MKRKLTIAAGIIHNPKVLFLDEPTTGVDVVSARHIRHLIAELHRAGTTIFLTTHYIEEAERLCERIAFIVSGRIVQVDTIPALLQPVRGKHVMLLSVAHSGPAICASLSRVFVAFSFHTVSEKEFRVESMTAIGIGPLVRFIEEQGVDVMEARLVRPSLEDVFVRVTGIETNAMKREKEKTEAGL
jgi:ABC-2 type transport system ATP-binding protein